VSAALEIPSTFGSTKKLTIADDFRSNPSNLFHRIYSTFAAAGVDLQSTPLSGGSVIRTQRPKVMEILEYFVVLAGLQIPN
jgi:hypothetical protein